MNYLKHVHVEQRFVTLRLADGSETYIEHSKYVLDSIFGLDWLPDRPLFESDLVLMLVSTEDPFPAVYHSGAQYQSAKFIEHLAGLAGACYSASRGERPPTPNQVNAYVEDFKSDYEELMSFRKQGYYYQKKLVMPFKIYRKDLKTRAEFDAWLKRQGNRT